MAKTMMLQAAATIIMLARYGLPLCHAFSMGRQVPMSIVTTSTTSGSGSRTEFFCNNVRIRRGRSQLQPLHGSINSNVDTKDLWSDDDDDDDDNDNEKHQKTPTVEEEHETSDAASVEAEGSSDNILERQSGPTHLIAIPLQANDDLNIELESVQRAVLYNCPLLIDACIVPALTRLPLLYVDTSSTSRLPTATSDSDSDLTLLPSPFASSPSVSKVTEQLHNITQQVIQEYIGSSGSTMHSDNASHEPQPLMMQFQGLEVDGNGNEVLYCVGKHQDDCDDGTGTQILSSLVVTLQQRIESELGYTCLLPPDKPQSMGRDKEEAIGNGNSNASLLQGQSWRPRIPFMRLPSDFEANLPPLVENEDDDEQQKGGLGGFMGAFEDYRSPEEGGNGISPILWYKWWNDEFTKGDGVRLRQVGIYQKTQSKNNHKSSSSDDGDLGLDEQNFYIPNLTIDLPSPGEGQEALRRYEEEQRAYMQSRYENNDDEDSSPTLGSKPTSTIPILSTSNNKWSNDGDALSSEDEGAKDDNMTVEEKTELFNQEMDQDDVEDGLAVPSTERSVRNIRNQRAKAKEALNEPSLLWTPDTPSLISSSTDIGGSSSSTSTSTSNDFEALGQEVDTRSDEAKAKKPWPKEPLIAKFQRIQGLQAASASRDAPMQPRKKPKLPPYPSDDHFQGVWRVIASPNSGGGANTGNDNEDSQSSSSSNMILRVDGSVAGGPILDLDTNQKAAGGSWRMYQAEYVGDDEDDAEAYGNKIKTRLQVRLLIPPSKTEELCLDGEVTRLMMPHYSSQGTASAGGSSFGNLNLSSALEDKNGAIIDNGNNENQEEALLHCGGEAWIQNIETGERTKLKQPFALMKLPTPESSQLHYSVPVPRRGL
jgi:hypothetical protein